MHPKQSKKLSFGLWGGLLKTGPENWTVLLTEWLDIFLIGGLALWTLGQLAFSNIAGQNMHRQKETSVYLCRTAASVCLVALFLTFFRSNYWSVAPFFNETFKVGILLTTVFVLQNSPQFIQKHPNGPVLEYSFFVTTGLLFLLLLVESDDFITLFLNLVGFSLSLYVLIMMFWSEVKGSYSPSLFEADKNYRFQLFEQAHEASLKYFYLSAFSSSLILFSSAIFYTMVQTVSFDELQIILVRQATIAGFDWLLVWKKLFWVALALYTVGFAFKLSAFPSYFWAPEVYQGAASPVTAFIIMPVKIGVFAVFARTLVTTFELFHDFWGPMLLLFGLGSLIVGAFGALTERVFKKFIAYSSINQIGFLLVGISTGRIAGLETVLLFFLIYILTTVALFLVFLNLENEVTGQNIRHVSELGFLSSQKRLPQVALTVVFFSLAGLPPFAGFFSKFYVLLHLLEEGFFFVVFIGIGTSLISIYYYLTLVIYIWFGSSLTEILWEENNRSLPTFHAKWSAASEVILVLILVFLSCFWLVKDIILVFSQQLAFSCVYFPNGRFA